MKGIRVMRSFGCLLVIIALLFFPQLSLGTEEKDFLKGYSLGKWQLDFGLSERLRYEYKNDFDFNRKKKDNGSLLFNRLILNSSLRWQEKYELFIEGLDARVGNYRIKKATQSDTLDLHQAYLQMNDIARLGLDVKLGRQEMKYGAGRLIWASGWSNKIASFDAGLLHYKKQGFWLDLFASRIVNYDDNNFNRHEKKQIFSGIYSSYQRDKKSPLVEGYFLSLVDWSRANKLERYTAGLRLTSSFLKDFAFDLELPYQFGKDAGLDIRAYALHFDISYSLAFVWKSKITLEYNLASGDKKRTDHKTNTFIPLYQSTHEPYGIMDFFRWQNMRETALSIALSPHKKWQVISAINFFWLDSKWDAWYNSSGTILRRDTKGQARTFVGNEASLVVRYALTQNIKLESGYAHFFSGDYLKDTGTSNDADWCYFQIQIKL